MLLAGREGEGEGEGEERQEERRRGEGRHFGRLGVLSGRDELR
jgi:hypothetical protein